MKNYTYTYTYNIKKTNQKTNTYIYQLNLKKQKILKKSKKNLFKYIETND